MSILLYGCTTWTLTKKLHGNWTRMLRAVLNRSWRKHPTKQQLYGHLLPISKTIQIRWTRHAGHCWRSKGELISNVLLWTFSDWRAGVGRPARIHLQQLCMDTGCSLEDLPEAMDDREEWQEKVREICARGRHDDDDYDKRNNSDRTNRNISFVFFLFVLWFSTNFDLRSS